MTTTVDVNGAYYTFGDTESIEDTLDGKAKGQVINGINGDDVVNHIYGDAYDVEGSRVGNDMLTGGDGNDTINYLHGDAKNMEGGLGGNDVLTGGNCFKNEVYGDAFNMKYSKGGNDVLIGGLATINTLFGDAERMEKSLGGNDMLFAGHDTSNALYGDASTMFEDSRGGNDVLTGGDDSTSEYLYGDASTMVNSQGGNDVLIAGDNWVLGQGTEIQNRLYGDALSVTGNIICGNDRLVSGTGNDAMYGDFKTITGLNPSITTGHDVFVFYAQNGHDIIYAFEQGKDKIELHGTGVGQLVLEGTDMVIQFVDDNSIKVIGVTSLTDDDFLFA